jgi:Ser/Thr protein kinase RdoA (MazF antagonist)
LEFKHQEANRYINWDLQNTAAIHEYLEYLDNSEERNIVEHFLLQFEMNVLPKAHSLRKSIIHNDGNDHNILIQDSGNGERAVRIIDFGDMVYSFTAADLAVVLAYSIFDKEKPLETAAVIIQGYNKALSLEEKELDVLFYLTCARLCISVCMSAYQYKMNPGNEYLKISEKPAWDTLKKLIDIDPEIAKHKFKKACSLESKQSISMDEKDLLTKRNEYLGSALSLSYKKPLKIVRGFGQYLYDEKGDRYLDCVNNVCHVGHCHPRVVRAAQDQIALLNTNTRYLHDTIIEYAVK